MQDSKKKLTWWLDRAMIGFVEEVYTRLDLRSQFAFDAWNVLDVNCLAYQM